MKNETKKEQNLIQKSWIEVDGAMISSTMKKKKEKKMKIAQYTMP